MKLPSGTRIAVFVLSFVLAFAILFVVVQAAGLGFTAYQRNQICQTSCDRIGFPEGGYMVVQGKCRCSTYIDVGDSK